MRATFPGLSKATKKTTPGQKPAVEMGGQRRHMKGTAEHAHSERSTQLCESRLHARNRTRCGLFAHDALRHRASERNRGLLHWIQSCTLVARSDGYACCLDGVAHARADGAIALGAFDGLTSSLSC